MGPSESVPPLHRLVAANPDLHFIFWCLLFEHNEKAAGQSRRDIRAVWFCSRCCFDDPYSCSVTSREYFTHTAGRQTSVMPHPHQQMAAHPQIPACVRLIERDSCSFHGFAGSFVFFMFTFTNMFLFYFKMKYACGKQKVFSDDLSWIIFFFA